MRFFALLVVLTVLFPAFAGGVSIDRLSKTVVFLRQEWPATEMKDGKKMELWYRDPDTDSLQQKFNVVSGTGLIIRYRQHDYVVTAQHVAKAMSTTGKVVMSLPGGKTAAVTFEWLSQQEPTQGALWFHHPDADISIHPFWYPESLDQAPIGERLFPRTPEEVPLLTPVYVLGFPMGLGVKEILSPLAKQTEIASRTTSIDSPVVAPSLRFVILAEALAQGYSGAPVFCIEDIASPYMEILGQPVKGGERLHFVGIVSSGLSDVTGGKITLVVPIPYLWDILDSEEFTQYERQH